MNKKKRYQLEHQCGLDNIKTHTPQIVINKWVVIFKSFQCYFYTQGVGWAFSDRINGFEITIVAGRLTRVDNG